MTADAPSIHASAVQVGGRAVLIRGPSGSGKSRLALELILAGRARQIPAATLIGDDRIYLDATGDVLVARSVPELAGLIEVRGLGIRRCAHVESAVVGLVVDLSADDAGRVPANDAWWTILDGVKVQRLPIAAGQGALTLVLAALTLPEALTIE